MTWFEKLTGFKEESISQVQQNIVINDTVLISKVNGKSYICGSVATPSLEELRNLASTLSHTAGPTSICETVANVQDLHCDPTNRDSLFQVASQFNLLEMASPSATPELGVGIYQYDPTQGPACAVAAGAGTILRNYFVAVDGQMGQTADRQIDCLADLGAALGNTEQRLWSMQNGYVFATEEGLIDIAERLRRASREEQKRLKDLLRIGLQWNTEVTIIPAGHTVSQAYCSALPVAYSNHSTELWQPFAQLVLDATYEATLCAAMINYANTGNNRIYLTLVGGGVFGNHTAWIMTAIERALKLYPEAGLDVKIVSYGRSNPQVQALVAALTP